VRIALLTTSYPARAGDAAGEFVRCEAQQLARAGHEVHVLAPGDPLDDGDADLREGCGADANHEGDASPGDKTDLRDSCDGDANHEHERVRADDEACGLKSGHGAAEADGRSNAQPRVWRLGGGTLFGWPGAIHRVRASPLRALHLIGFSARAHVRLQRIAPQRLIAHFIVPCGYPLSLANSGELEVVLHGSDARFVCSLPRLLRCHLVGALLARGALFRFPSEQLRREFTRSFPPGQAQAIQQCSCVTLPAMSLPVLIQQRERQPAPVETWVACGRLIASKRVDRVIREAAKRGVSLTVVGDGPERAALQALARQLLPTTRFTGQLPRADALAEIAACDRLVHLSELEGAPSVIREARALGVRVLASAAGDVAEWAARDPGIELFELTT
jgi:teichuronic acid biosynthesis glycosyltransferase TuaC